MKYVAIISMLFVAGCTTQMRNPKYDQQFKYVKQEILQNEQAIMDLMREYEERQLKQTQKMEIELEKVYKEIMVTREMLSAVNQKVFKIYNHLNAIEYADPQ